MTLVTVQLSRQGSLNGICDIAKAIEYEWNRAGLELPRRNTLSNANMKRDPKMAENVFWKLLEHFKAISPAFASSRMVFLTNNFSWSGRTIAELYRARWGIETFFKEIKQTCQIHDFIGTTGEQLGIDLKKNYNFAH